VEQLLKRIRKGRPRDSDEAGDASSEKNPVK
jgi:hypothetical protein